MSLVESGPDGRLGLTIGSLVAGSQGNGPIGQDQAQAVIAGGSQPLLTLLPGRSIVAGQAGQEGAHASDKGE